MFHHVACSDTRREPTKVNRCALLRPTTSGWKQSGKTKSREENEVVFMSLLFYLHKFGFLLYLIFLTFDVAVIS